MGGEVVREREKGRKKEKKVSKRERERKQEIDRKKERKQARETERKQERGKERTFRGLVSRRDSISSSAASFYRRFAVAAISFLRFLVSRLA